jgi:hypothetical protein
MAQEQIQIEYEEELMQAQQMKQMLQQQPQNQQLINQANHLMSTLNSRKAILIAEMMKEYMTEEQKIISEFVGDPLLKLKSRELDLKARENQARKEYDEGRISLDTMKAMMNQQNTENKLEQTEELAELRAETSLTKQIMSNESKKNDFGRNFNKN